MADYNTVFEVGSSGFRLISSTSRRGLSQGTTIVVPYSFRKVDTPRKTGGAVLLTRGVTRRASLPLCRAGLPFHQSATPEVRGCGLP